ncbi:Lrp/AsnC family transcriptional regulator [Pseudooceanicola sp. C21-150M6]|uniref:Lrp/AsnC family transcriptional regulator n=1 Tax=Pseudooceanicola sp. C21-150M6 TaxID=3434355 RepID=UPI003D7FBB1D
MTLDRIDRKIVTALMTDATIPLARLADRVGLTVTPCWKRVRRLTDSGIIRARVAIVDPERIGLGMVAFVGVSAPEQSAQWHTSFAEALAAIPEVMEAYQMAGTEDYVLRIVARDMPDFERVRQRLVSAVPVRGLTASFALRRLKSETVLPIDTLTA